MQQFQDEQQALDVVLKKLRKAYDQIDATIEGYNDEYMDLKKYMADYKNEMDKIEIFSNQQMLQSIDRTGVAALFHHITKRHETKNNIISLEQIFRQTEQTFL